MARAELVQAYEALKKLGDGTPASQRLELRVLTALSVLTYGGYAKGSAEYQAATERLALLSKVGGTDRYTAATGEATACFMGPGGFYALEGGFGKPEYVHTTPALLGQAQ